MWSRALPCFFGPSCPRSFVCCGRSTFELGSCIKMAPIYEQFEETVCADAATSLALLCLITFGLTVVGMAMITLRSAMYPCEQACFAPILDEEKDEWEEYQVKRRGSVPTRVRRRAGNVERVAFCLRHVSFLVPDVPQAYLQYVASFVSLWSGQEIDEENAESKAGVGASFDTPSTASLAEHRRDLSKSIPSDEEVPLSPETPALAASFETSETRDRMGEGGDTLPPSSETFARNASFERTQETERMYEDDERRPLSPSTPALRAACMRAGMYEDEGQLPPSPDALGSKAYFKRAEKTKKAREVEDRQPLSPSAPALCVTCGRVDIPEGTYEEEERMPLSPDTPALDTSFARPETTMHANDDDELAPLSPESRSTRPPDWFRMHTPQTRMQRKR